MNLLIAQCYVNSWIASSFAWHTPDPMVFTPKQRKTVMGWGYFPLRAYKDIKLSINIILENIKFNDFFKC